MYSDGALLCLGNGFSSIKTKKPSYTFSVMSNTDKEDFRRHFISLVENESNLSEGLIYKHTLNLKQLP